MNQTETKKVLQIVDLLEKTTSRAIVSEFLESKKIPKSFVSWSTLFAQRLEPAINDHLLSVDELLLFLRDAEEHGKQHIFLYKCNAQLVPELIDRRRVEKALAARDLEAILGKPLLLSMPAVPSIAEVRWDESKSGDCLLIKEVERRESQKAGPVTKIGNKILKEYILTERRAVNVAKLHPDGLLEIRLASHAESSYENDLNRFWKQLDKLIPKDSFREISLSKAKKFLADEDSNLDEKVRFSTSMARNDDGITLSAATGSYKSDLSKNVGARKSIAEFLRYDDAYCDAHNFYLVPVEGILSRELHVVLSGEVNEFAITVSCSKDDYEYALRELRAFNR